MHCIYASFSFPFLCNSSNCRAKCRARSINPQRNQHQEFFSYRIRVGADKTSARTNHHAMLFLSAVRPFAQDLEDIREAGLWRELRSWDHSNGKIQAAESDQSLWNFAANDYLGLSHDESLRAAFQEGLQRYGHGSGASRLVSGSSPAHRDLEQAIAEHKKKQSSLLFSTGFAVAMGIIPALLNKTDFVVLDKLSHACLIDAARLSGATIRVFPQNDVPKLRKILASIRATHGSSPRILIVTESVFSMDGDIAPLTELVQAKEEFEALLLVDEAHGYGVLGATGGGLAEAFGLQERIDLQMGTLSKAAGLAGGFIAADGEIIQLLINRARSFIYSTAPPPALAFAASHAVAIIRSEKGHELREKLAANIRLFDEGSQHKSAIFPHVIGNNQAALNAASRLREQGFLVPAIRYPTVPRNTARLRISLSAAHPAEAILSLRTQIQDLPR